uniref:Heat shock protein 70 n=1 Tax=Panagrolaimus sp. PS1159 TaxID=55785 RepID=A0AC35GGN0_9BILA
MSTSVSLIGGGILVLLIAGYLAQRNNLIPPPTPKIVGIDLGTTFSSIGVYQAVTGETEILPDSLGKRSIPSVVGFLKNGTVLIGTRAVEQQEHNPKNTIYDAKRFIGKTFKSDNPQLMSDLKRYPFVNTIYDAKRFIGKIFKSDNPQLMSDLKRYPFVVKLDSKGKAYFEVELDSGIRKVTPEEIGSVIIKYLKDIANEKYQTTIPQLVISVPAEFDENQRNYTKKAAELAGLEVRRIVSEPTAAALAYGLHKKKGVEYIVVFDLGGGTLDVSIIWLQGGVFVTQAMAGNNRLGGQDFNERTQKHLIQVIEKKFNKNIVDKEDIQQLRLAIEEAKIRLTDVPVTNIRLQLRTVGEFNYQLTRNEFEELNKDLFDSIIDPIEAALADCNLKREDIDEIVLVGGSTRIPKVRQVVGSYFGKAPNFGIDPELAVVTGAAVQAGVIGGGWPLEVTAMELPTNRRKVHLYTHNSEA